MSCITHTTKDPLQIMVSFTSNSVVGCWVYMTSETLYVLIHFNLSRLHLNPAGNSLQISYINLLWYKTAFCGEVAPYSLVSYFLLVSIDLRLLDLSVNSNVICVHSTNLFSGCYIKSCNFLESLLFCSCFCTPQLSEDYD